MTEFLFIDGAGGKSYFHAGLKLFGVRQRDKEHHDHIVHVKWLELQNLCACTDDLEVLYSDIVAADQRGVSISALLTGEAELDCGRVAYHPPLESELQELTNTLVVVTDHQKALIASESKTGTTTTITSSRNLVLMARQFVWMELFAQRVLEKMGRQFLEQLEPEDREILVGTMEVENVQ